METTENESTPTIVYCKGPDTRRSKWQFPTAISKLQHRETPLGAILTDLNFFDSLDDVKPTPRGAPRGSTTGHGIHSLRWGEGRCVLRVAPGKAVLDIG